MRRSEPKPIAAPAPTSADKLSRSTHPVTARNWRKRVAAVRPTHTLALALALSLALPRPLTLPPIHRLALCDETQRASVDVLVIDEAGQFSLANALAVSVTADSLVLLGTPLGAPRHPRWNTYSPASPRCPAARASSSPAPGDSRPPSLATPPNTSTATASTPRGFDFLFSLNRLNVATSRSQTKVSLLASPRLLEAKAFGRLRRRSGARHQRLVSIRAVWVASTAPQLEAHRRRHQLAPGSAVAG